MFTKLFFLCFMNACCRLTLTMVHQINVGAHMHISHSPYTYSRTIPPSFVLFEGKMNLMWVAFTKYVVLVYQTILAHTHTHIYGRIHIEFMLNYYDVAWSQWTKLSIFWMKSMGIATRGCGPRKEMLENRTHFYAYTESCFRITGQTTDPWASMNMIERDFSEIIRFLVGPFVKSNIWKKAVAAIANQYRYQSILCDFIHKKFYLHKKSRVLIN